jgi:heat shock protein HspQ
MQDKDIQLGQKVQDKISGFTGIVTKAGNHLTGCERYGVYPAGEEVSDRRGDEEFFFSDQLEVVEDDTEFRDDGEDGYVSHEYELGQRVEDRVTGFEGVVTVINYRLWNCPSIHIQSTSDADEGLWTDVHRLQDADGYEYVGEFKNGVEGDDTSSATGSVEDSMTRNDKA